MSASHVAIIMDGNGRWAQLRGLSRTAGHEAGAHAVRRVVQRAVELGVGTLTLFAFSTQNWARSATEVHHLMRLLQSFLEDEREPLLRAGVRFCLAGDRSVLPSGVRAAAERLERATEAGAAMTLALAVSYGGQEELVRAARRLAESVARGELTPEHIDHHRFVRALTTGTLPPVDLLIRTSGEQRLSNFMLFECAYAELLFSQTLWPDFDGAQLEAALADFARRDRRFGATRIA